LNFETPYNFKKKLQKYIEGIKPSRPKTANHNRCILSFNVDNDLMQRSTNSQLRITEIPEEDKNTI
jgi:hypothetical protein